MVLEFDEEMCAGISPPIGIRRGQCSGATGRSVWSQQLDVGVRGVVGIVLTAIVVLFVILVISIIFSGVLIAFVVIILVWGSVFTIVLIVG